MRGDKKMENKIIDKLLSFIADLFLKIKNAKKLTFVGNVYWGSNTWTAPEDGFINMIVSSTTSSTYHLLYVADAGTNNRVGAVVGIGAGSIATAMIPVIKGKTYKTSYIINNGSLVEANYFKLGGY